MAVIKCSNCENEILDTDIVCPYCDHPVRGSNQNQNAENSKTDNREDVTSDRTMKVDVSKITANSNRDKGSDSNKKSDAQNKKSDKPKSKEANTDSKTTTSRSSSDTTRSSVPSAEDDGADMTRKVSSDDVQSEALRRSLEERRAARENERKKRKKRKDSKLIIIGITVIGIFVIIYLLANVISNILGEGIFDKEKENKKAEKVVTSEAEMADKGFKFHSHTLTIVEQSVLMDDYAPNSQKPWKEYSLDTSNLTIASGIENISAYAFDDLINLTHVTIAPTVSSIGDSAFYGCSKLEVIALDSAKSKLASIGDYAFTDCSSLEDVVLGKKIKRIGDGAFKSCDQLKKITIPETVTEIGTDAFLGCPDLVIVCDNGSYAHEYAIANGIDVELSDKEEETESEEETFSYSEDTSGQETYNNKQSAKQEKNKESKKDTEKDSKKDTTKETNKESTKESNKDSGNNKTENTQSETSNATSNNNSQTDSGDSGNNAESPNLDDLIKNLNEATTQEEKDKILGQIDDVVGGN